MSKKEKELAHKLRLAEFDVESLRSQLRDAKNELAMEQDWKRRLSALVIEALGVSR